MPGPRVLLRQLDVAGQRREAVPEAAVDASLGGVQRRDRLAALVGVLELAPHDRRQHAAAAVRRQHADGHHAGSRDLRAAGHRRVEAVSARAADDLAAVEPGKHALRGQDRREPLELLGLGPAAEVVPDRRQRGADLLRRGLPDLDHAIRLERRVVEHQATLAAVAREAHRDDAAALDRGDDAFAERLVADGVAGRERRARPRGARRAVRRAVARPRRGLQRSRSTWVSGSSSRKRDGRLYERLP